MLLTKVNIDIPINTNELINDWNKIKYTNIGKQNFKSLGFERFDIQGQGLTYTENLSDRIIHYVAKNDKFRNATFEIFSYVRLLSNQTYSLHTDPFWVLHVPVIINDSCGFIIDDALYQPKLETIYLFNTKDYLHTAYNTGTEDRIHYTISVRI